MYVCVCCVSLKNSTRNFSSTLVHVFSASFCTAAAWNFIIFDVKLVVIRQFFAGDDASKGKDYDVLLTENINNFRVAVWLEKVNRR